MDLVESVNWCRGYKVCKGLNSSVHRPPSLPQSRRKFPHYLSYFSRFLMLDPEARPKSGPVDSGEANIITRLDLRFLKYSCLSTWSFKLGLCYHGAFWVDLNTKLYYFKVLLWCLVVEAVNCSFSIFCKWQRRGNICMKLLLRASDYIIMIQLIMHAIYKYTFWEIYQCTHKPILIEFRSFYPLLP